MVGSPIEPLPMGLLQISIAIWFLSAPLLAQTGPEQKPAATPAPSPPVVENLGPIDVLSNTYGFDFGPYLQEVLRTVRINWYSFIPESAKQPLMKKGKVDIEFAIMKDGTLAGIRLVGSSGDQELDRAAWGGIMTSSPLPPLPAAFHGTNLALRFHFYYNPEPRDLASSNKRVTTLSQSGVTLKILVPSSLDVPAGGSAVFVASVEGAKDTSATWSVFCPAPDCGEMHGDLYTAPSKFDHPISVTLSASSNADPSAIDSVSINIVPPKDPK
jgi:TonB family protein